MKKSTAFFIYNADFENVEKRAEFLMPINGFSALLKKARSRRVCIESMCDMPVLTKVQEQHLFRQYNCLKFILICQGSNLIVSQVGIQQINNSLSDQIKEIKDILYMCNIRLLVNFLKKRRLSPNDFMMKFSDTCCTNGHAIDLFDYSRGFRYSTYLTWSLIKNTFTTYAQEERIKSKIRYLSPEQLLINFNPSVDNFILDDEDNLFIEKLFRIANLNKREIEIIEGNLGLYKDKQSLESIGNHFHVSKERIRQIKLEALRKLKKSLKEERV